MKEPQPFSEFPDPRAAREVTLGGLTATVLVSSVVTLGAVAIVEHTLAPGFLGAPPHTHLHEDEISYLLEGTITVLLGSQVRKVSAGQHIVKPRGIMHTMWNSGPGMARFLDVIAPGGFEDYFAERAALTVVGGRSDPEAIALLQKKYQMSLEPERIPELLQRYGLRLT